MASRLREGTVTQWLKAVGESVGADEPLLEISTDKVDTEVPPRRVGSWPEILVQEGETVDVGTVVGTLHLGEGAGAPAAPASEAPAVAAPTETAQSEPARAADPAAAAVDGQHLGGERTFVSPVVARIAAEHSVDVASVVGTGGAGASPRKTSSASSSPAERAPRSPRRPCQRPAPPLQRRQRQHPPRSQALRARPRQVPNSSQASRRNG